MDFVVVAPLASVAITEYPVIALPLFEGAVHARVTVVLLAVELPLTLVGVPGVV